MRQTSTLPQVFISVKFHKKFFAVKFSLSRYFTAIFLLYQAYSKIVAVSTKGATIFMVDNVKTSTTKFIVNPVDKLSKDILFSLDGENFAAVVDGEGNFSEDSKKKIRTVFYLELLDNYGEKTPLNFFDRCVLVCCLSAQETGGEFITDEIIFRMLTGRSKLDRQTTDNARKAIFNSVVRLMSTVITVDMEKVCGKFKYNGGEWNNIISPLLPCVIVGGRVGGKEKNVVKFTDVSPLLRIAKIKNNQLISYSTEPLNAPKIRNTAENICLKNFLLLRVNLIKSGRLKNSVITFESVCSICGIEIENRNQKFELKQKILKFLEHLKTVGEIKKFNPIFDRDLKKSKSQNQQNFHGVKIEI